MRWIARAVVVLLAFFIWAQPVLAKDVTLNFKNADIRAVIEYVAGITGKNFLVDNKVRGTVTIISPKPIPEKHIYDVFLSVLEANGYAAIPSGSVVKIVPRAQSNQEGIPVTSGQLSRNDRIVTQVIRLEHADAQQLVGVLSPLISPNSHLVAYVPGNMLILTDTASNIDRIREILDMVDRSNAASVKLYKLHYASADKMAQTLTSLYGNPGGAGQTSKVRILAHQPGNILIVVAPAQVGSDIADVISRLDVKPEHETGTVQVRYLKNANAKDVAKVITQLVSGQRGGNMAQPGEKSIFEGEVKVVPDTATNALLITADPADMRAVNHIIDKLDIRRLQVLIEALIVDITGNDAKQLGIDWMSGQSINNGRLTIAGAQNFGTIGSVAGAIQSNVGQTSSAGQTSITSQTSNAAAIAAAIPSGLTVGVLRGSLLGGTVTMGALIHALQSTTNANILSTPDILTMDNEPAEIIVGQNVPFIIGQNATQGGTAVPFQTIERKDIGLTLKVTPQISEGDTVRLKIYQEVSSLSNTTGASDIITNMRSLKTVALAQNHQMLVLGGLMREDTNNTVNRVPCIGAIPIIGEPFQFTSNARTKTNLMIFLRPTIVRNEADIQAITEEKYRDMKDLYEQPSPKGTIFFPQYKMKFPKEMVPGTVTPPKGKAGAQPPASK